MSAQKLSYGPINPLGCLCPSRIKIVNENFIREILSFRSFSFTNLDDILMWCLKEVFKIECYAK